MKINGYIFADVLLIAATFFVLGYMFCLWVSSKNLQPWE